MRMMKATIRKELLAKRQALAASEQEKAAEALARGALEWFMQYCPEPEEQIVAGYMATRGELDLRPSFSELAKRGYTLALPCVEGDNRELVFRSWQLGEPLIGGPYGIEQPECSAKVLTPNIVLVPLVAADKKLNRLGYGGGYYDVTIDALKRQNQDVIAVGIAHDFQRS